MKSKLIIAVLFISLAACNFEENNDLAEFNLKGKVKSVTGFKYKAVEKFGKTEKGKRASRDTDNELDLYIANSTLKFDEKGTLNSISFFNKYGDLGLKMIHEDTIIDIFTADGSLMGKMIGDDRFAPKEMKVYDDKGKFQSKLVMTYDEHHNVKEKKEYNRKGELKGSSTFKYNDDNQLIERTDFKIEKKYSYYEDEIDTIKTVFYFTYNEQGYEAEVKSQSWNINDMAERDDPNAPVTQYEYTYDEQGNWILRIERKNEIPQSLIEREIAYYN